MARAKVLFGSKGFFARFNSLSSEVGIPRDPYFPIGQASLSLTTDGLEVIVALKTLTPNAERLEMQTDGGQLTHAARASGDDDLFQP